MPRRLFDKSIDGVDMCPRCGALPGEYHSLGCMAELCPKCDKLLVTCTCSVMDAEGKAIATRRLFNAINNHIAAWVFAAAYPRKSPLGLAGWLWVALNSDPDLIFSMVVSDAGALAGLKASHYDQAGHPRCYSVADVARILGCSRRLTTELTRAFADVEAGRDTEALLRVH
ncbi:MAG: hypothetical protein AAGU21_14205 [Solidesulfovibrio sp.]|uniref:hypothetical protein n=1 Tax=Solidesulfovibrio sp. TaxID=2910990 RepID=UPI002B2016A4|nr:hypothetical protein [Solidesulfovibrio sp.]MEA4856109.1 hypothetical protein [Solidesulfovibrio sp.]